jgi:hypothetical protein
MLQKLADHISICFDQAAVAERRAEEAGGHGDLTLKRHYEEIAKAWRHLATRRQLAELERFIVEERATIAPH